MTPPDLQVIVPGPLEQRTGGYLYDARMVEGLRALGWRVGVINLEGSFPRADEVAAAALGAALGSIPDGTRVVIDGLAMGGLPGVVESHGARLRILSLLHHPLAQETGLSESERSHFARSERDALRWCRGVVVTSGYTARALESYGVPPHRVRAVPPGTAAAAAADGPGPGEPPRLLCVGTVTPRKGHDVLVAALARVRELRWTCVCAGSLDRDSDFAGAVRRQVVEAGLEERVEFVGEHSSEALDELYRTSSMFVLASHFEGYGMALAEALARGLPIVSTTGGAIPFTVPAECGVLVAPADDRAFAEALRGLLGDGGEGASEAAPSARIALAAASRRYAEQLPDWEQAVQTFATAVLELAPDGLENNAPVPAPEVAGP